MARLAKSTEGSSGSGEPNPQGRRVLFVCSSGGHLAQLLELEPWYSAHDCHWVTFDLPDARSRLGDDGFTAAFYQTTRNLINAAKNLRLAHRVISDFEPHVVISNGAAVAIPFFLEAKRRKIPTVFLEVYDRIDSRTMTGRLARPLVSSFLVQWPEQQALYEGSELIGTIY